MTGGLFILVIVLDRGKSTMGVASLYAGVVVVECISHVYLSICTCIYKWEKQERIIYVSDVPALYLKYFNLTTLTTQRTSYNI